TLSSTFADQMVATPEEWKRVFEGSALHRDATFNRRPAALYVGQIRDYAGNPIAVLEIVKDTAEYEAAAGRAQLQLVLVTLAGPAERACLRGGGLSRRLSAITAIMNRLSSGDLDVSIPGRERREELGTMAKAVDVFRRGMIETRTLREAQEAAKHDNERDRKA